MFPLKSFMWFILGDRGLYTDQHFHIMQVTYKSWMLYFFPWSHAIRHNISEIYDASK